MNIRKNIDYSDMYAKLDNAMAGNLSQMELYYVIGEAVGSRSEKGAAVAAAEYLKVNYPDAHGFSPRNLRRMREFYQMYEAEPILLQLAMQIGWTQNILILEADLNLEQRKWYLQAVIQFRWKKSELIDRIASRAHEEIVLDIEQNSCCNGTAEKENHIPVVTAVRYCVEKTRVMYLRNQQGRRKRGNLHWIITSFPIFIEKKLVSMRC